MDGTIGPVILWLGSARLKDYKRNHTAVNRDKLIYVASVVLGNLYWSGERCTGYFAAPVYL